MATDPAPPPRPPAPPGPLGADLPLPALGAALAALALGAALDLARGPWTTIGFEEAQNARAGLAFACGHFSAWRALLYRPFCGGCTVDGLLAAPLLRLLGPVEGAWKLVPAGASVLAGLGLFALSRRLGGARAGWLSLLLLLGAPWAHRELALTGWGNHAEALVFPFWGLFSLVGGRAAPRFGRGLLAGVLLSFGVYYTASVAWAWPVAALLAAAAGRGALLGLLLGAPLGLLPWAASQLGAVSPVEVAADRWLQLRPAPPAALLRALVLEPLRPGALWPADRGPPAALGSVAAGLLGLLGLAGAARAARRGPSGAFARLRAAAPALCLLSLVLAFALRYDLWAPEAELLGYAPFTLRYRVAFGPLLVWGAAAGLGAAGRGAAGGGAPGRGGRLGAMAALALGGVGVFGLGWRALAWSGGPAPGLQRPLLLGAADPDPTVPEGQPPTRRAAAQGRAVDLEAARVFAVGHVDPLPRCAAVHAGELARRLGLGPLDRPGAAAARQTLASAPAAAQPALWASLVEAALGAGLLPTAPDRGAAAAWAGALGPMERPAALRALGRAWGARAAERGQPPAAAAPQRGDPLEEGLEEGRGLALARRWTEGGRAWPTPPTAAPPEGPALGAAGHLGLGLGLGAALGCGARALAAAPPLSELIAEDDALRVAFDEGVAEGCAPWGQW